VAVRLIATKVIPSFSCKASVSPNANYGSLAKVQSQNMENPTYTVQNIALDYSSGGITQALLKAFIAANYESTSPLYLSFKYGGTDWLSYGSGSTNIPVQINGTVSINVDTTDSDNAYLPNFSLTLTEQFEE
jgi:hypothetical protein